MSRDNLGDSTRRPYSPLVRARPELRIEFARSTPLAGPKSRKTSPTGAAYVPLHTYANPMSTLSGSFEIAATLTESDSAYGFFMDFSMPAHSPRQNRLLAALPVSEFERLSLRLELVPLAAGEVLYESGSALKHIYFPIDSIVSLLYITVNGASVEIAGVGNDGALGIALFMGGDTMRNRAVVQCAGYAYRLKAELLKEEFNRAAGLQHLLLRYTQALLTQMSQTAVCNRYHSLNQQLCRWLLLSLDRLPSNEMTMTQELIANMLGVRRGGITQAAIALQKAGLIHYSRGHITVVDRPQLELRACECYQAVKTEVDRLLPLGASCEPRAPTRAEVH